MCGLSIACPEGPSALGSHLPEEAQHESCSPEMFPFSSDASSKPLRQDTALGCLCQARLPSPVVPDPCSAMQPLPDQLDSSEHEEDSASELLSSFCVSPPPQSWWLLLEALI